MTDDLVKVTVADGKYTFGQRKDGSCYALRYGDPWREDIFDGLTLAMAHRIEQLVATNEALTEERERLALAICGGEDAPGYANAQTVETLEDVARDWGVGMMEQINRTLALEAKLATCEKYRDAYDEMGRIGTQAVRDLEAKLAKAVERLTNLEKSASEVSRYGAATGPQWTKMSIAILAARATLAEIKST